MRESLLTFLESRFGYSDFRPGQLPIIQALLNQEDVLGILPTGTGKSLIYQFYGLYTKKRVLVVSPLLSLMYDQVHHLQELGIREVVAITSFLSRQERTFVLNHLGQYQFIFLSPEMLQSPALLNRFRQLEIGLMVLDEAHCVSQWGLDFRVEYARIGLYRSQLGFPQTLALTATATPKVEKDILTITACPHMTIFRSSIIKENIFLKVLSINSDEKLSCLKDCLSSIAYPAIIYFSSIAVLESVKAELEKQGITRFDSFHSRRSAKDRQAIQKQFEQDQLDFILATSAFGMGIDKDHIRTIIHYQSPYTVEDYVQQIGRAGRDGQPAEAISFYDAQELIQTGTRILAEIEPNKILTLLLKNTTTKELSESQQTLLSILSHVNLDEREKRSFLETHFLYKKKGLLALKHLFEEKQCMNQQLATYFGESFIESCGRCSKCLSLDEFPVIDGRKESGLDIERDVKALFHQLFRI